jgi:glycosyltransferase involved in cell wall biosynthesis
MEENKSPNVGIGLPVYNNSKYLSQTLDSILNQTYSNIIVYLSDDCSIDGTEEICELYAKKDKRIIYSRAQKNTGSFDNHLKVLEMAKTDYFMFARGHEILSPTLVKDCIKILEQEKSVVLAFATPMWIDEDNNIMGEKHFGYYDTKGTDVIIRCAFALWGRPEYFYGLMLTENIKKISLSKGFIASDALYMFELALLGGFAHTCTSTRYRRYHYSTETYKKRIKRNRKLFSNQTNFLDYIFPFAKVTYYLFKAIKKSNNSLSNKIKISLIVFFTAPLRYLASRGKQL